MTIGGEDADVDYEWTDWFDILDKVDSAIQLDIQVKYGRWSLRAETMRSVVGARARLDWNDRWAVLLESDLGGFGVGSELAWYADAGVEWRASRWFALQLGWRVLQADYAIGASDERFVFELRFNGPYVGFLFLF